RITGIPENEVLEVEDPLLEEIPREPVVDEPPIPEGLGLNSDSDDIDVTSDLEDNFVELAGGSAVKYKESGDEASEEEDEQPENLPALTDMFPQNKVLMMERFLYGDNERERSSGSDSSGDDEAFENPDDATVLNRQFEKLLLRCRSRGGSASQSQVTGTSMLSEGLQYALSRDSRTLHQQHKKLDDVEVLDDEVRQKTICRNNQLQENSPQSTSSDESDDEVSGTPPDIMSVQSDYSSIKPSFNYLAMPVDPGKSRTCDRKPSIGDMTSCDPYPVPHLDPTVLTRKKDESQQEKHLRKLAVKQYRRERRKVRKANQHNFRAEHEQRLKTNARMVTIG
ncbi:protein LTV1, partial [Clonorchis sinensis]